jgi:nitrate/TMAO reductase-like tetraheme cytochrome c subunit
MLATDHGERKRRRWPIRRLLLLDVALIAVLVVLAGWALNYTSQPSFCSSCHPIEPFRVSWEGSSHEQAGVSCTDCHFEPGAFGYMSGKLYSVMKLVQWVGGQYDEKPEAHRTVVAGSCRHCHEAPTATFLPHASHADKANLACVECHSGVVHGAELVGEQKPQAAADPAFCGKCHTGEFAPILFGEIEPVGREHPGAPKIDVNVWRNLHWRVAAAPAVIDGMPYDRIEPDTCLACHPEPTQARTCKACHFSRVPEFRVSTQAKQASGLPLGILGVTMLLFGITVALRPDEKRNFFTSRWMQIFVGALALSDVVIVYLIVRDSLLRETGSVEIGPTTVWITYLLVSIAIILLVLYQGVIRAGGLRFVMLPKTDEDDMYIPDPRKRKFTARGAGFVREADSEVETESGAGAVAADESDEGPGRSEGE